MLCGDLDRWDGVGGTEIQEGRDICVHATNLLCCIQNLGFEVALVVKNLPAKAGDIRGVGLVPELGRSPGGGHGNPL